MYPRSSATCSASRRRILTGGAAVVGTLGTAGCIDEVGSLSFGQEGPFGDVDVPEPESPDYRAWIPALDDEDGHDSHVLHLRPDRVHRSLLDFFVKPTVDWFGVPFDSYERAVMNGSAIALDGPTDRSTVASALEGTGYEAAGSYEGYDLYERTDHYRRVAAGDGRLVFWSGDEADETRLEATVDAFDGRRERRHEVDEPFEAITDASGAQAFNWFGIGSGSVAGDPLTSSTSAVGSGEYVYVRFQFLYPSENDVPLDELRATAEAGMIGHDPEAIDVHAEGRLGVVDHRVPEAAFATDEPPHPQITWGIERNGDALVLGHEGGSSVAAERLHLTADGGDGLDSQFEDEFDTVEFGDSFRVEGVADAGHVRLIHRRESESAVLLEYEADG